MLHLWVQLMSLVASDGVTLGTQSLCMCALRLSYISRGQNVVYFKSAPPSSFCLLAEAAQGHTWAPVPVFKHPKLQNHGPGKPLLELQKATASNKPRRDIPELTSKCPSTRKCHGGREETQLHLALFRDLLHSENPTIPGFIAGEEVHDEPT